MTFYLLPTDIVNQILNFGLPAPLDIQIIGADIDANHALAESMMSQLRKFRALLICTFNSPSILQT